MRSYLPVFYENIKIMNNLWGIVRLSICTVGLIFAAGCSITPVPFTSTEISEQIEQDRAVIREGQEPATRPISVYEAIARSVKYNLDLHLEIAEKVLAQRELALTRYDQLPQLAGNLAFTGRSNDTGATSQSLLTGNESLEQSTSSEREVVTGDISISWNVLDFGVSYFRAQQAADKVLIAEEQKRKVINRIVQDVRTAYWRAVSNDRLIKKIERLTVRVDDAIVKSKRIVKEKLDKPLTALTYQRELIGIKRQLGETQRELSLAKIQLAALMNLPPGQDYELVIPERTDETNELTLSPQMMEQLALENRSELREISYEKRIKAKELKVSILNLLPGINLNFGQNYDDNEFLFNNDWLSYGASVSYNLINALKIPATKRTIDAQSAVLDARRLALSMAILTQVHVSLAQHRFAVKEYETAADYHMTQTQILEQILAAAQSNSVSEQAVIREEMNTLVAEIRFDIAFADIENAYANSYAAMGIDLVPPADINEAIEDYTDRVEEHIRALTSNSESFSMEVSQIVQ